MKSASKKITLWLLSGLLLLSGCGQPSASDSSSLRGDVPTPTTEELSIPTVIAEETATEVLHTYAGDATPTTTPPCNDLTIPIPIPSTEPILETVSRTPGTKEGPQTFRLSIWWDCAMRVLVMDPGDILQLDLGGPNTLYEGAHDWLVYGGPPGVLSDIGTQTPTAENLLIYEAIARGHTLIGVELVPHCLRDVPPCIYETYNFDVQIVVR